ncbi:M81 family metallopeptidase [Nakamurella lactea]|uniref:M81 family metallopeptidase n=1 Tax=Nakamurella lactea TaxID=459515 RepID=UPI0003F952F5|nr:M81 family metallopeptidase [Nakamurella lactea]
MDSDDQASATPGPRIALAGLMFEANSFAPGTTDLDDFERRASTGDAMLAAGGGLDSLAAAAEVAKTAGARIIPTWQAGAMSGPPVAAGVYPVLRERLLASLRPHVGNIDGVYLSLHGAMVARDCEDTEGDLLQAVRELVGLEVPIAYSADLHTHFTAKMAAVTPLVAGYHTLPHLDIASTGRRAMALLLAAISGAKPALGWRKIAMVTSAEGQDTNVPPMSEVMDRVHEIIAEPGVLDACVFATQPWLDVTELGWATLVITDGDPDRAQDRADELARMAWDRRHRIEALKVDLRAALEQVRNAPDDGRPFVLSDGADSVSAGATGDGVQILAGLVADPVPGQAIALVTDAPAALELAALGVGRTAAVELGGTLAPAFHRPVKVTGTVMTVSDGRYLSMYPPAPADVGTTAVLRIEPGKDAAVDVVITSRPASQLDLQPFRRVGLEPTRARIVVVKSAGGYRGYYEPLAADCIDVDTTGPADSRLERLPYTKPVRPLFPFDPDLESPW